MSVWCEDFATSSLEEVFASQAANRAWSKELRLRSTTLVNNRLAKLISQDAYLTDRKLVHEDTAECRRRAAILETQIGRHIHEAPPRPTLAS
jgi:hypothetical protein